MPRLFGVLLLSLLLILPAWTVAQTSKPVAEVSGSALLRQAEDLEKEVAQLIQTLMEQGFVAQIGQVKAIPVPDSDFVDLRVSTTVSKSPLFEQTLSALANALDGNAEPDRYMLYHILHIPSVHATNRRSPVMTFSRTGGNPASLLWVKMSKSFDDRAFDSLTDYRLVLELDFSDSHTSRICQLVRHSSVAVVRGEFIKADAELQRFFRQLNKNLTSDVVIFNGEWNDYGRITVRDMDEQGRGFVRLLSEDKRAEQLKGEEYLRFLEDVRTVSQEFGRVLAFIFFRDIDHEMYDGKEEVRINRMLADKLEKIRVKFRRKTIAAASERGDFNWCSAGLE